MTTACQTCGRCAASTDRPDTAAGLLAMPLQALARALGRRPRRQTADLLSLDDHLLADIGVSRDEVRAAVREGRKLRRANWPEPAAPVRARS